MKKITVFTLSAFLFCFSFSMAAYADDASEIQLLRAEIERLSARLEALEIKASQPAPVQQETEKSEAPSLQTLPDRPGYIALAPYWHDGLHIVSADKAFDISIGGRIHMDTAVMSADQGLRDTLASQGKYMSNGSEIRRAQLEVKGTLYQDLYFKMEYNFAQGGYLGDLFVQWNNLPYIDHLLMGKASRAFGLGGTPSSNYQTFMESPSISIFGGGGMGLAIGGSILNQRMSWGSQLYGNIDGNGITTDAEPNLNLRLTGLPWYVDRGRNLMHLGISYKFADENDALRYKNKPSCHLAPYFVDTGDIKMSNENVFGFDTALCIGPFSIEGEYDAAYIQQKATTTLADPEDLFFHGFYMTGSYFLTGENRGNQYMTGWGAFDSRVHPLENFSLREGTWGAWQLAARYSGLMLSDHNIDGGEMATFTAGLNWYWNSTTRIMLNYVHSHLDDGGNADIGEARFHLEF